VREWEREKETERENERKRGRENEREREKEKERGPEGVERDSQKCICCTIARLLEDM